MGDEGVGLVESNKNWDTQRETASQRPWRATLGVVRQQQRLADVDFHVEVRRRSVDADERRGVGLRSGVGSGGASTSLLSSKSERKKKG